MAELFMTEQEKIRVQSFIREQQEAWERKELQEYHNQRLEGKEYQVKEFPGFDEATALQAVRNGWKSQLDLAFERKYKQQEGKV